MFLFMTLAFANDQSVQAEVESQVAKACRRARNSAGMAADTVPLRRQAELLSQTVHDLAATQLPELKNAITLVYDSRSEPATRDMALLSVSEIINDLQLANRELRRDIASSDAVGELLQAGPRPNGLHGLARRQQSVRLCTTDRVRLWQSMVTVGELLDEQEPVISRIITDFVEVALNGHST